MSTSLLASTVTPGSTAPVVSFTTPTMLLWALAWRASRNTQASADTTTQAFDLLIGNLHRSIGDPVVVPEAFQRQTCFNLFRRGRSSISGARHSTPRAATVDRAASVDTAPGARECRWPEEAW